VDGPAFLNFQARFGSSATMTGHVQRGDVLELLHPGLAAASRSSISRSSVHSEFMGMSSMETKFCTPRAGARAGNSKLTPSADFDKPGTAAWHCSPENRRHGSHGCADRWRHQAGGDTSLAYPLHPELRHPGERRRARGRLQKRMGPVGHVFARRGSSCAKISALSGTIA
jgi:hypothetical protein